MGRRKKIVEETAEPIVEEVKEVKAEKKAAPLPEMTKAEETPKADNPYIGAYTVVPEGGLNLRKGASKENGVIAVLPKNTKVECEGEYESENGIIWLKVKSSYGIGYVMYGFLKR